MTIHKKENATRKGQIGSSSYINNNNNIFFKVTLNPDTNWCMRPPWGKGPPMCSDLTAKVYRGVHTLPLWITPFGFEPVTS